jgi:hypothetical protein
MFFRKKPATEKVTFNNVKTALDKLLAEAESVHINRHVLVDLLESRAQAIRVKQAMTYSVAPRVYSGNI